MPNNAFVGYFDGVSDATDILQAAIDKAAAFALSTRQSFAVFFNGIAPVRGLTMRSGVTLDGQGQGIIKLRDGYNTNVIEGASFQTLTSTNSGSGISKWRVANLEIDGNRTNNTSAAANNGHGLAAYGRDFSVENVYIRNCRRSGLWLEYGNGSVGTSPFNGRLRQVTVDLCGEHGIYLKVSDLHGADINVRSPGQNTDNTYDAIYFDAAAHLQNINIWKGGTESNYHRYALNIQSDTTTVVGATLETSKTAAVNVVAAHCQVFVRSYNLIGTAHIILDGNGNDVRLNSFRGGASGENTGAYGVQIGNSTAATYNSIYVNCQGCDGGVINFNNSGGSNHFQGTGFGSASGALIAGTPSNRDWGTLTQDASASADRQQIIKEPNDAANGFTVFGTGVQADATVITKGFVKVLKSGSGSGRLRKDASNGPVSGEMGLIYNSDGTATSIYPHTGGQFKGLATNAAVSIPAGGFMLYWNGPSPIPYTLI